MNILFLLRLWPVYGGGETVTICLANEMVRRGWQVTVAYFKDTTREQMPFIDSRIKTLHVEDIDCDEFMQAKADSDKAQDAAIEYIKKNNVDVVINQWWLPYYISRLKKETKAKVISCLHQAFFTPILDEKGIKGYSKRLFRPIYESWKKRDKVRDVMSYLPYVDRYVFLSPHFQHQFESFAHYVNYEGKLDAIPNPTVYNSIITEEKFRKKENIVLLVGRMLEGQKRITRALRIWELVQQSDVAKSWRFVIVGDGPDLPMYKQIAADLKLERISFEGYQQPLPYYEKSRIFLMTSQFEGFGMTLVESQQQGVVPMVMDSFLSLHDIVKSGINGIIVPNRDEQAFATALIGLMGDKPRLDAIAHRGMETCQEFSVSKVVDRWEKLINEI